MNGGSDDRLAIHQKRRRFESQADVAPGERYLVGPLIEKRVQVPSLGFIPSEKSNLCDQPVLRDIFTWTAWLLTRISEPFGPPPSFGGRIASVS